MRINSALCKLPALIATATIATAMGLTAASPAHAQNLIVNLMSVQNSECLQPLGGSLEGGIAIVQMICNGSTAQQWTWVIERGLFTNGASGMCLDARGTSAPGTPIQQWPCAPGKGISNQVWEYAGNVLRSRVNPKPGSNCLATTGSGEGAAVELQLCDGSNPQKWYAPQSAPVVSSSGNLYVALPTQWPISPHKQEIETALLWVGDWLMPSEIRRVTDQFAIRGNSEAESNNRISCAQSGFPMPIPPGASSGTNYPNPSGGQDYQWNASTLLVAPNTKPAFFICLMLVYTTSGSMFAVPPQAPLNLISVQNSKCLQPLNGSTDSPVAIVQMTCNGSLAQQWTRAPDGGSFTNGASGWCLDARGTSAPGTPIQQWPCAPGAGISNQVWDFGAEGNGLRSGVNPSPDSYCLTTPGNGDGEPMTLQLCDSKNARQQWNHPGSAGHQTTYGTWLQMSSSDQAGAQLWPISAWPTEWPISVSPWPTSACPPGDHAPKLHVCTYIDQQSPLFNIPTTQQIVSVLSGKCLQPLNGSTDSPVAIVQMTCNDGSLAQRWTSPLPVDSGGGGLINDASGWCLDAHGTSAPGTPIQQWPCAIDKGISNQFWDYGISGNALRSYVRPSPETYCLATPGNNIGDPMELQPCNGSTAQQWTYSTWTGQIFPADNSATSIDAEATMEVTTCHSGTDTCKSSQRDGQNGEHNGSTGKSFLELQQLNPDGSTCQVNLGYPEVGGKPVVDEQFGVDNNQHHLPLYWHVSAPVSQLCGGSRKFSVFLLMQFVNGNPIKIEGGNINIVNSATAPTATVPNVIGLTEQQANAAIAAAGLSMAAPAYVTTTARVGTVVAQNSPGGTVEPARSPVQITVSKEP
jgi:hypothetical protein